MSRIKPRLEIATEADAKVVPGSVEAVFQVPANACRTYKSVSKVY